MSYLTPKHGKPVCHICGEPIGKYDRVSWTTDTKGYACLAHFMCARKAIGTDAELPKEAAIKQKEVKPEVKKVVKKTKK